MALAMIRRMSVLGLGLLVLGAGVPAAHAQLSDLQVKCVKAIGKAGKSYVKSLLKTKQKCKNANLKEPSSCPAEDQAALDKATDKLNGTIEKSCAFNGTALGQAANLGNMGFPGPCTDNTGGGFVLGDLQACIKASHDSIVGQFLALQYDATVTGPLDSDTLKCQQTVGKETAKHVDCVLNAVQKCRNAILSGKSPVPGLVADNCATGDPKTAGAHAKCVTKLESAITSKCPNGLAGSLKLCTPDQTDSAQAADCEHQQHMVRTDSPAKDVPADLIDYEYATRGGLCGDGIVNSLDEECDGTCPGGACTGGVCVGGADNGKLCDDTACPGACGTPESPDGFFACLCKTPPPGRTWQHRVRVVDQVNADFDEGWTGQTHDQKYVAGGGFLADLYECDANGDCIVGPHCSLDPTMPCSPEWNSYVTGDSICQSAGKGVCVKERTATGPHCYLDPQKECDASLVPNDNIHCGGPGDFCVKSYRSPPLPLSAQNVQVCVINVYAEDVVGTMNAYTGSSSLRVREKSITYMPLDMPSSTPCPVCGGFCAVSKERCANEDGCAGAGPCITNLVCSAGPDEGKPCRITPPFGGPTPLFGSTSIDCRPSGSNITGKGLDIIFDPYTTGYSSMVPTLACQATGFQNNACLGGSNQGRPCDAGSECPGGTCSPQCFCPQGAGVVKQKPNACDPACLGGPNDKASCAEDSECPMGFCHSADCRWDPDDHDSIQEGKCTAGPVDTFCSKTTFRNCAQDADCVPGPNCPYCEFDEHCIGKYRSCFVNSLVEREGLAGIDQCSFASVYCIEATTASSVNTVTGLPGPGTIVQPGSLIVVPQPSPTP